MRFSHSIAPNGSAERRQTRRAGGSNSPSLPKELDVQARSELIAQGLNWWKVKLERSARGNEYLLTVALQDGFPSRVLAQGLRHWITSYFHAVMADALKVPSRDGIAAAVRRNAGELLETFQHEIIYDLATDLVTRLIALRRALPGEMSAHEAVVYLDAYEAGWRESLPLHLPAGASADDLTGLFGDLLTVDAITADRSINVHRLLFLNDEGWRPGIALGVDGELDPYPVPNHLGEGRFQARLTGDAGVADPQAFAQLYLHNKDGRRTLTSQPLRPIQPRIWNVPLTEAVIATLTRSDTAPIPIHWPGGAPVASTVTTWRPVAGREDQFELAGQGSIRSKATDLLALAPSSAIVRDAKGEAVAPIRVTGAKALWRVHARAIVQLEDGARYRIAAGSVDETSAHLSFGEIYWPHVALADRAVALVHGPLRMRLVENGVERAARSGEVIVTARGRHVPCDATGALTVTWRDAEGFVLDRRRALVVPRHADLGASYGPRGDVTIDWSGWEGWTLWIDGELVVAPSGRVERAPRPEARCAVRLVDPQGADTSAMLEIAASKPRIVDREGRPPDPHTPISMDRIRSLTLQSPRAASVCFELLAPPRTQAYRVADGDVPLHTFHELIGLLLGLSQQRGPSVRISMMNGPPLCVIKRPQQALHVVGRRIALPYESPSAGYATAYAVARPLLEPQGEHALDATDDGWLLPERVRGPALVYLRDGETVLTRPRLAFGAQPERTGLDRIQTAALAEDERVRVSAVDKALHEVATDPVGASEVRSLRATVASLRGLSPRAIDAIGRLPRHPNMLARLLVSAEAVELPVLLAMERDLPFLWMAIPFSAWGDALEAELKALKAALDPLFDDEGDQALASLMRRLQEIQNLAPWFFAVRRASGMGVALAGSLRGLAQDHVRRHADSLDRPPSLAGMLERERLQIPGDIGAFDYDAFPALLAPLALAAATLERVALDQKDLWAARSALELDETYVQLAYPHCVEAIAGLLR